MFFNDKKDEGLLYEQFYKPFPEVGLALILTAVSLLYPFTCTVYPDTDTTP